MKKLFIISNESIFNYEGGFFCDNTDLKSTPEGLNNKFEVNLIGRESKKIRSHRINIKNIKIYRNFLSYLLGIFKSLKEKQSKYLIISISPFTFAACILIKLFNKKPIMYLRSDGHGEYKAIFGFFGPIIYSFMFNIVATISNLISCTDYILKGKKGKVILPSQLDLSWLRKSKAVAIKSFKLLYVGRVRVEKGIFSLANIIRNKRNISLTIVGADKKSLNSINQNNIKIFPLVNNKTKLMKFYDDHNIFILPSFTEGHPMVLLESLARRRPVIIFNEIEHVIGDKRGIFVAKRNFLSFLASLNHIKKNYKKIQSEIRKNKLPTNKEFIDKFVKLINKYN